VFRHEKGSFGKINNKNRDIATAAIALNTKGTAKEENGLPGGDIL